MKIPRENLEIVSRSMAQIKSLDVWLHLPGLDSCWWYNILRYSYIISASILLAYVAIIAVKLREISSNLIEFSSRHYHLFVLRNSRPQCAWRRSFLFRGTLQFSSNLVWAYYLMSTVKEQGNNSWFNNLSMPWYTIICRHDTGIPVGILVYY